MKNNQTYEELLAFRNSPEGQALFNQYFQQWAKDVVQSMAHIQE